MKIFNNWYKELKELREENKYYSRECYLKEERYRKLNKEHKELEKKYKELLKEVNNDRKTTRREHNTRKSSVSRTTSKQTNEI